MTQSPLYRALALFLASQPFLWVPNIVLAQSLERMMSRSGAAGASSSSAQDDYGLGALDSPSGMDSSTGGPSEMGSPATSQGLQPGANSADASADRRDLLAPTRTPPVDAPVDAKEYRCGPGDVFELHFWGLMNLKLRVTVDLEGRAFVPKLGHFAVGGKSLADVRELLRSAMARVYPRLGFDVALAEPRSFIVHLADAVARPGSKVARAVDRVATVIVREGGISPHASKRRIEIHRRDGSVVNADLLLFVLTGDVKHNPYLLEGDVVRVPFEDVAATVSGAVNRPGRYELTGTRDLAELVELAGGLSTSATRGLPVSVVRRTPDERSEQQLIPFGADGALPAVALQREDVVRLPGVGELEQSVFVVGALSGVPAPTSGIAGVRLDESTATKRLPFVEGDTVRTLLDRVNGVGPLADLERSYIIRGGRSVPVDLGRLVMLRDLAADVPLQLGDTLVVPFRQRNVAVQGAVFAPGSFPYNPSFGVEQYLALAGGRNRFAQGPSGTRIITPEGATIEYSPNVKVQPGAAVVVPERNFSRPELVQIALGIASVIVSGVAVMLAARK